MSTKSPNLYVIAGPNGAGKTTFAKTFLPRFAKCRQFVNADLIAAGLSPLSPEASAIEAGKLLLGQIRKFAGRRADFGFETTLSGMSYRLLFQQLKRDGYHIHAFFLWIPTAELALSRIRDRVAQGGHSVPEQDVRRRFKRGLRNFFRIYLPLFDSWTLFDNAGASPEIVADHLTIFRRHTLRAIREQAGIHETS